MVYIGKLLLDILQCDFFAFRVQKGRRAEFDLVKKFAERLQDKVFHIFKQTGDGRAGRIFTAKPDFIFAAVWMARHQFTALVAVDQSGQRIHLLVFARYTRRNGVFHALLDAVPDVPWHWG
mgnify:CR=1 FL=1